jgi:uncharacterized protein
MTYLNLDTNAMRQTLLDSRVVAIVGYSTDPNHYSHTVGQFLREHGYEVIPVNPNARRIAGHRCYASLKDIPKPVDVVDVFRDGEHLLQIVEDAIAIGAKTVWAQIGIMNEAAKDRALEAGLNVAMNRCMKVEYIRLLGE